MLSSQRQLSFIQPSLTVTKARMYRYCEPEPTAKLIKSLSDEVGFKQEFCEVK